ncbi:hypothetical protein Cni_G12192 [Canna indica]|uniref:Myb-like domain-containing protein n=1 Tax=Canna indica TaxID=4628 RepID=A0AAQ3K7D3_9LILI|nr:hypothetical protein Cni_G12192 [Canna indica]
MDLHELQSLIAGKPGFSSVASPAHFMGGQQNAPGYAPAPLPEQYRLLLASSGCGGGGGSSQVDLISPPPLQPQPPPQQQQQPGFESFAFFETAFGGGAGGGSQGRWPRQETLTLLEVRSRLDSKFREAAHKGPLWDEVSRIMAEEHGYQRSGKKCREKLENLYKYYKKTKEGKAGRQDGKHYRFFRQLEALYGGSTCNNATTEINHPYSKPSIIASHLPAANPDALNLSASNQISLSNSSEFSGSSSDEEEEQDGIKMGGRSWKSKVGEFIDAQIKRFIDVQETWMNQMLQTLEQMEQARISREEDWRKQEAARFDRECSMWADERAWTEARDAAIMQALEKISHRRRQQEDDESPSLDSRRQCHADHVNDTVNNGDSAAQRWPEAETASLVKIRSSMEAEFLEGDRSCKAGLWEEVSAAMTYLGYNRSPKRCKEKWDSINRRSRKVMDYYGKKRIKKSSKTSELDLDNFCSEASGCGGDGCEEDDEQRSDLVGLEIGDDDPSPSSYDAGVNGVHDGSTFLFSVGQEESLWVNNGVRNTRRGAS